MKIAHVIWGLTYGGIETMLVNIANEQVKMGAEVHVIVINDLIDKTLSKNFNVHIQLHCIGRKPHSKNPFFALKLTRLLKKINPDAIHLHRCEIIQMIFSKRLKMKTSVTIHDMPSGSIRPVGIRRFIPMLNWFVTSNVMCIERVPHVFAISQAVHEAILNKYGVNSIVVCNGICTNKFSQRPVNIYDGVFRIVMVSRLVHEKKGQDLLIKAIARLNMSITVDFIGEGKSMNFLQNLARDLNIAEKVNFLGNKEQNYIFTHLKDYDLFIQPSRYEGFGLTCAEAMASNVPVLVSGGQGPSEITCGDTFGWTFESGDYMDLSDKIKYIYNHYNEALGKVKKAHQHVVDNYDVSITAKKYLDNYIK